MVSKIPNIRGKCIVILRTEELLRWALQSSQLTALRELPGLHTWIGNPDKTCRFSQLSRQRRVQGGMMARVCSTEYWRREKYTETENSTELQRVLFKYSAELWLAMCQAWEKNHLKELDVMAFSGILKGQKQHLFPIVRLEKQTDGALVDTQKSCLCGGI